MNKIKEKFVNVFYNFAFIISLWYSFWVRVTAPKKNKVELPIYSDPEKIIEALNYGRDYKPDPLRGFLDIMYNPREVQHRINNDEEVGDCDDHAIYWASCLLISGLAKYAWIGAIYYEKDDGSLAGHAICVFRDHEDKLFWADYNKPSLVESHDDWIRKVGTEKYGKRVIAAALVPVVSASKDGNPKFGKAFRIH